MYIVHLFYRKFIDVCTGRAVQKKVQNIQSSYISVVGLGVIYTFFFMSFDITVIFHISLYSQIFKLYSYFQQVLYF